MLVIASPGQGAQKSGFLRPWLEIDSVRELTEQLSDACQVDLITHGTESDEDTIRDTAIAQPLLVAASIITHSVLFGSVNLPRPQYYTGHSVGEVAAAALSGVLEESAAMKFVALRSRAMAQAAKSADTGMAAVVGGVRDDVLAAIAEHGLTAANINGAAQVVAAGAKSDIESLISAAPARARVIPLQVAGAFHSPYMETAREELRAATTDFFVRDPQVPLVSNANGSVVHSGADYVESLVTQVASPVQWYACMQTLVEEGVTGIIELAPAGTLTGLMKRDAKSVARCDLNTPDDLDAARAFIREHAVSANQGL